MPSMQTYLELCEKVLLGTYVFLPQSSNDRIAVFWFEGCVGAGEIIGT